MKAICYTLLLAGLFEVVASAAQPEAAIRSNSSAFWRTAAPEEVGIDSAALVEMLDFVRARSIPVHSVQLVRGGRLVLDAYFYPYDGSTRHDVASVTKSVTSTLIGLAIERGRIRSVQEPVLSFFPEANVPGLDPRKQKQTLEHLLTMQSGWDCGVPLGAPGINADTTLAEMRGTDDWARFALDLPLSTEPGTRFLYCNANCHVLSTLITRVTGMSALAFARRELFEPIGIREVAWAADPKGNSYGWGDLQLHPRDMARLGQLFLQNGRRAGRQVVPKAWLRTATSPHVERTGATDQYGYFWWMAGAKFPGLFEAVGRGGQRITVWPAKDLVLVYTGGGFNTDDLSTFILKALKTEGSNQSLPPNPETNRRLKSKLAAAVRAPSAQRVPALPEMAARISGRTFNLTSNNLDLATLKLTFDKPTEATLRFKRLGKELRCPVGLDGVERFSKDTLEQLPFAAKGKWSTDRSFLLELNRVAGISVYDFEMNFEEGGKSVKISLSERTGLGGQQFTGTQ